MLGLDLDSCDWWALFCGQCGAVHTLGHKRVAVLQEIKRLVANDFSTVWVRLRVQGAIVLWIGMETERGM